MSASLYHDSPFQLFVTVAICLRNSSDATLFLMPIPDFDVAVPITTLRFMLDLSTHQKDLEIVHSVAFDPAPYVCLRTCTTYRGVLFAAYCFL